VVTGDAERLDAGTLAHELRNTLNAIDLLLEHAETEIAEGRDPSDLIAKARAGVAETAEIVARRLEG
jgi:signal transduction histidine kinase